MYRQPPKINTDTAADIERQLIAYLILGCESDGVHKNAVGSLNAMIKIFSYYCQLIIDRQNQSLDKNFLAFLNLLGASLKPAQPARVLLTFTMAKGASVDALIPKGTQVAAQITSTLSPGKNLTFQNVCHGNTAAAAAAARMAGQILQSMMKPITLPVQAF